MVQEQLSLHEEEGQVVECPGDREEAANFVIEGEFGYGSA